MKPLTPTFIAAAVQGDWIQPPASDAPIAGVSIDSREAQAGKLFIAIVGDKHDGHDFADAAVRSGAAVLLVEREINAPPGVGVLRVANTRAALMQLATEYRKTFDNTTVVAITGSAGKTTTRQLTYSVLSAKLPGVASPKSFNNDIGVPLTLLAVRPEHRFVVAEVGINAVGEMQPLADIVRPDIAIVTNIGDSHLEGLGDRKTVAREKLRLTNTLPPNGSAILHADSAALRDEVELDTSRITWFGETTHAHVQLASRVSEGSAQHITLADSSTFTLALAGRHNAINALVAIAVGRKLGLTDAEINTGLSNVTGLPMRMDLRTIGPVRVMNDAYNANPQSMLAGVEAFLELTADASRHVLVLGDMRELGDAGPALHERTGRDIASRIQGGNTAVFCIGELASNSLATTLRTSNASIETAHTMTPETAESIAAKLMPGDAVFIKGSRSMALEPLVDVIVQRFSNTKATSRIEVSQPASVPQSASRS